jgi:hypothetical protein
VNSCPGRPGTENEHVLALNVARVLRMPVDALLTPRSPCTR